MNKLQTIENKQSQLGNGSKTVHSLRHMGRNRAHLFRFGFVVSIVTGALMIGGFAGSDRLFAPKSDAWPYWEAHNPGNRIPLDNDAWNDLLARYLTAGGEGDGVTRFDYGAMTEADREALDKQIDDWARLPISDYRRDQQLAYWINLYNALTVVVVLNHYPVSSIRDIDISPGFFSSGPWDGEVVMVEGQVLTLNDIEHRILRPGWRDPRIHYAVNCASYGCPDLASVAYTAENAGEMLNQAARAYVNHPRGISVDGKTVTVSKIYSWYVDDFGGDAEGVLSHIRDYADPALVEALEGIDTIHRTDYDWTLNDAKPDHP